MKRLFIIIFALLLVNSCREEIIPPDNPSGNVNQPFIETFLNSYSFTLNAGEITYNIYEFIRFDQDKAQVFMSVLDHTSGYVEVYLYSKTKRVLFYQKGDTDIEGESIKIDGHIPETLIMNFFNFTGKLRFTVNKY